MAASALSHSFDHYELLARLDGDVDGEVYLARARTDQALERLLTITVIPHGLEDPDALLKRVTIASRAQHRNLIRVLGAGPHPDGQFIVCEHVEGFPLPELQRRDPERRPRLIVPVIIDALYGLHAACALAMHEHLSPRAILVGADGIGRITDLGRTASPPFAYQSPEQVMGREVDHRSNLFSMGVLMWNSLTGKNLFQCPTDEATRAAVLDCKVPRPSMVGFGSPAILDQIVLKALDRDPAARFQSAEEMAHALRDLAIKTSCLGTPSEIATWVASQFAREIGAHRHAIRDALRSRSDIHGAAFDFDSVVSAEPISRDLVSTRAEPIQPLSMSQIELRRPAATALPAAPMPPWRRPVIAIAAFAVVLAILGWRWSARGGEASASAAPDGARPAAATVAAAGTPAALALEVTVLGVRSLPAAVVTPAPEPTPAPPPAQVTATRQPPRQAPPPPPRRNPPPPPVVVTKKAAATPARPERETPAAPDPTPAADPPPAKVESKPAATPKPDSSKPTIESNPYLYK